MRIRRLFLTGLAGGFLSLIAPLLATTVEPPSLDSLIGQSDYVVRAVVKSTTPEWREHEGRRYIRTAVELDVREVIKGAPPSPLVLDLIGGKIGDDELVVEGMPRLQVGEEHVLFVHGKQRRMMPLVALMHGIYPVMHDTKSGQRYALRSNGMPLYSAQDVSLPLTEVSSIKRQNPQARPLTVGAFISQIRQRALRTTTREN
jgi:hypothetical protein